jgi:chromosome segregation ATPase
MSDDSDDRTASLMTPAKLAQLKVHPKAAASPAAWLDQMAADAGAGHVRRLADLRAQLEAQVRERDVQGVAAACQALNDGLGRLDFSLLQPKGWLARATGKGKEEAAGFVAQHERMARAGEELTDQVRTVQRKQQAQASGVERSLLEMEVELRAIEKIMEQGARWLQDMRNQLKARQAGGGDAAVQEQIRQDNARCEVLVARLKQLRAASSATQHALDHCKGAASRRSSLMDHLQQLLDGECKSARQKLGAVADQASAGGAVTEGIDRARRAQQELQAALKQAAQDCGALQAQDQALADELAALQVPLQAAA